MRDVVPPEDPTQLRKELERYRIVAGELEGRIRELQGKLQTATTMAEMPQVVVTRPELSQTLWRLMNKVAMIVQAGKVLILIYQPEIGELGVLPPALGITPEEAAGIRITPEQGITGTVFRTGESAIFNNAGDDPRTLKEIVAVLGVRNGICVPLTIKQRDDNERIVSERPIGVMHVFNKRYEQEFNDDDVRLLEMLAEQAAAVISNAQIYIKLTEEKQRLEETFESIHAGVIVVSTQGSLRLINRAACDMLGLPPDGYEGQALSQAVPVDSVRQLLEESLRQRSEMSKEIDFDEGRRIFKAETSLMSGDDRQVQNVVAIFNDITEIRQVERMKTAFVSTVSHELRTPLTSIKGFISTLLDDTDEIYDGEMRREFYEIIDQECDRLTRLISDLLNISRIESGRALDMHWSQVNLYELTGRQLSAQQQYTHKHTLVNKLPTNLPTITADADKIVQILDNLIGNAIKYAPEGGEIAVSGEDEGETVRLDIIDHGLGIPAHHRDKIFQRFHMVDDDVDHKAVKGTGIGLYLVKHLSQAHGGDTWLSASETGKGSTFSVRLKKQPPAETEA
jgi:PAS domain S-box-containing protein